MSEDFVCTQCKKNITHEHEENCTCIYCNKPDNIYCSESCLSEHIAENHET